MTSDTSSSVTLWGVLASASLPSPAVHSFLHSGFEARQVKEANHRLNVYLVVVGGKQTPNASWLDLEAAHGKHLTYLSAEDQKHLNFTSVRRLQSQDTTPDEGMALTMWELLARKNVGYLYAVSHGAEWLFDFEETSVLHPAHSPGRTLLHALLTSDQISEAHAHLVDTRSFHLYNPYPDFDPKLLSGATGFAWPRGFPLEFLLDNRSFGRLSHTTRGSPLSPGTLQRVGIFQSLADHNSDVDEVYRLSHELPLAFERSAEVVVLPAGTYAPLNGQATLFRRSALWSLLLPAGALTAATDTWRSYVAQRLLWEMGQLVAFTSPMVDRFREKRPPTSSPVELPEPGVPSTTSKLLSALSGWSRPVDIEPGKLFIQLYQHLESHGLVNEEDVLLVKAWVHDLKVAHYSWPPLDATGRPAVTLSMPPAEDERVRAMMPDEEAVGGRRRREPRHRSGPSPPPSPPPPPHVAPPWTSPPPRAFMSKFLSGGRGLVVDSIVSFRADAQKRKLVPSRPAFYSRLAASRVGAHVCGGSHVFRGTARVE